MELVDASRTSGWFWEQHSKHPVFTEDLGGNCSGNPPVGTSNSSGPDVKLAVERYSRFGSSHGAWYSEHFGTSKCPQATARPIASARQNGGPSNEGTSMAAAEEIATAMLSDDVRSERLASLLALIELMRPSVQADGGDLVLLKADVESGIVEVQLQGACSSCAVSSSTLQGGVERILKGRLDWVTDVVGSVDEDLDFEASAAMGAGGYVPKQ